MGEGEGEKERVFGIGWGRGFNTLFPVTTPHKPCFRDRAPRFREFGCMKVAVVVEVDKEKG
jgi:hypothetical protein